MEFATAENSLFYGTLNDCRFNYQEPAQIADNTHKLNSRKVKESNILSVLLTQFPQRGMLDQDDWVWLDEVLPTSPSLPSVLGTRPAENHQNGSKHR